MREVPTSPRRRLPLDGLAPRDFVGRTGHWPAGPWRAPWTPEQLADLGLSRQSATSYVAAVRRLAQTVADYEQLLLTQRLTQDAVARQLRVSTDRLSNLRTGNRFPSWDLLERLRMLIEASRADRS